MIEPQPSFSERMRLSALPTWNAVVGHRFFREIQSDTIEDRVFARYLRIEYGFVDCAAKALGYAVAKAPSFRERRRLALGLYGLVTDQEQFFVSAFERIGAHPDLRSALPPNALSAPLHKLFLDTAKDEGYEEILACTMAAEWMYFTWCSEANTSPSSRGAIRDWVALHADGAFAEQVAWIRSEIDSCAPRLSAARQLRLCALFEQALAAEILFHDAVYA
jgi:thiaminase (transcriptional activator TenA)